MEFNVAINIKGETLFRGANVFHEEGRKIARGEDIFPPGERKYFLPRWLCNGETLFRDTGAHDLNITYD